jgi:hypothetical protein
MVKQVDCHQVECHQVCSQEACPVFLRMLQVLVAPGPLHGSMIKVPHHLQVGAWQKLNCRDSKGCG